MSSMKLDKSFKNFLAASFLPISDDIGTTGLLFAFANQIISGAPVSWRDVDLFWSRLFTSNSFSNLSVWFWDAFIQYICLCRIKVSNCQGDWTDVSAETKTIVFPAAGARAPLSLTMAYAAPETVQAYLRGDAQVDADTAVDVWAVGVMAFELYTHRRVFQAGTQSVRYPLYSSPFVSVKIF